MILRRTAVLLIFQKIFSALLQLAFQPLMSAQTGFLIGAWQPSELNYWSPYLAPAYPTHRRPKHELAEPAGVITNSGRCIFDCQVWKSRVSSVFFSFRYCHLIEIGVPPISKGNRNLTDPPELRFIECQLQIHQYTIASTEILTYDHPTRGRYVIEWHFRTRICKILCLAPLSISLSSDWALYSEDI